MSKDKRVTLNQAIQLTNKAYDHFEVISVAAAERALKEEFGFGAARLLRFRQKYVEVFSEEAAKYAEQQRKKLRERF